MLISSAEQTQASIHTSHAWMSGRHKIISFSGAKTWKKSTALRFNVRLKVRLELRDIVTLTQLRFL